MRLKSTEGSRRRPGSVRRRPGSALGAPGGHFGGPMAKSSTEVLRPVTFRLSQSRKVRDWYSKNSKTPETPRQGLTRPAPGGGGSQFATRKPPRRWIDRQEESEERGEKRAERRETRETRDETREEKREETREEKRQESLAIFV